MVNFFRNWFHKYFSDEQAIVLALILLSFFVIVLFMGQILAPVFASIIIAYLMQGPITGLVRHKVPHLVSVLVVYLIFLGLFFALLFFVIPATWNQVKQLFAELPGLLAAGQQLLMLLPEKYPSFISIQQVNEIIATAQKELRALGQWMLSFSISSLPNIVAVLVYLVLVPILVFFFLKDGKLFVSWWAGMLPNERAALSQVWSEMDTQISNYIRGKFLEILIVGSITYIVFLSLGVNYSALLATLIGLSVVVPYIGAAVVTVPVALIGYVQWGMSPEFWYLMTAYLVIQALDGNVLVPVLFSEVVNLHPVVIILAVLVFGGFWGVWGVFFAIPLATLLKAVLTSWPKALHPRQHSGL